MKFNPSKNNTVGIEWELQLLDPATLDLIDGIIPLMEFFPHNPFIKPEYIQSCVELTSHISDTSEEAVHDIQSSLQQLLERCRELEMTLCGAGTHPFCRRMALITPMPRYQEMQKISGYLAYRQLTFSSHVHVGMTSGDEAMRVMSLMIPMIPVFIALSANSPFWRGHLTGHCAYRHRILAATRTYGVPPRFCNWSDYSEFLTAATRAGMIRQFKDIHWDIRPHPDIGTLELRVMDAAPDLYSLHGLAAFARSMILFIANTADKEVQNLLPAELPCWVEAENRYRAGLQGLEAPYIVKADGQTRPILDITRELIETCQPTAAECGETRGLAIASGMLNGNVLVDRQLDAYHANQSARSVVRTLVSTLSDGASYW